MRLMNKSRKCFILKVFLVIVTLLANTGFNYVGFFNPNMDNSIDEIQKENNNKLISPITSSSDFHNSTKIITKGYQQGTYNESTIQINDEISDSTGFQQGNYKSYHKQDPNIADIGNAINWGTLNGGLEADWDIENALQNPIDNNTLWIQAQYGVNYPGGVISGIWGGYSNLDDSYVNKDVYRIRIVYGIFVDYLLPAISAENLKLRAYSSDLSDPFNPIYIEKVIHPNPEDLEYVAGVWEITSATNPEFIQSINNGYYTYALAVYLDMTLVTNPLIQFTWIHIDFIDIIYDVHTYDVDFSYELGFGTYQLGTISEFEVRIDIAGTKSGLDVYLFNFNTSEYQKILTFTVAATKTITINVNASDFFNDEDEIHIRFILEDYYDGGLYSSYIIQVDQVFINMNAPDPPPYVILSRNILYIFLTWGVSNDYGIPISNYNVYRGESPGGSKALIGTPSLNEFNDTSVVAGVRYYYIITAVNDIGESTNSTEVSGKAYSKPYVKWLTPITGDVIIFPYNASDASGEWLVFNFSYDCAEIYDVELEIEQDSLTYNYGSVWNKNSIRLYPRWDGNVTARLIGYNQTTPGIPIAFDEIQITFVRTTNNNGGTPNILSILIPIISVTAVGIAIILVVRFVKSKRK